MPVTTRSLLKVSPAQIQLSSSFESSCSSSSSIYSESFPRSICHRVNFLRMIQMGFTELKAKFYEEVSALECKYAHLYQPYYDKRYQIISGAIEPTNEDLSLNAMETYSKVDLEISSLEDHIDDHNAQDCDIKGIPEFWLTVLKNVKMLREKIKAHDEPILKYLIDIRDQFYHDSSLYILEFHFEPNDFFHNTVLTKQYKINYNFESNPFSFEGPVVCSCKGCLIHWKKGKDVTTKVISRRKKNKSRRAFETVTKMVPNDSFFHFFNPPFVSGESSQLDDETKDTLAADIEIGLHFREKIIPRAVLFYTGEALSDFDLEEEDGGDEEEEEGEQEQLEEEEEEQEQIEEEEEEEEQIEEEEEKEKQEDEDNVEEREDVENTNS